MTGTTSRRKVIGATVIGIALVLGAFVMSDFGAPTYVPAPKDATATLTAKPSREYIPVADTNNDGVEDWREVFVDSEVVIAENMTATTSFTPTTVTDQVGVELMETLLINRTTGQPPLNTEQFVTETAERLQSVVQDKLYSRRDIIVIPNSDEAIRTYGNAMGSSLLKHDINDSENEIDVLARALQTNNPAELEKIKPVAEMYRLLRDDALNTPVPEAFVNEHLILINVYNALYQNLDDMQLVFTDPTVSLLRINRYQDDVRGLVNGFNVFFDKLLTYQRVFRPGDTASVFSVFNE